MTLQLDFWVLVGYLIGLIGFLGGLARWLMNETEKRQAERFASLERLMRDAADKGARLEREVLEFKVDVPVHYVRRAEFIHYQQVVESRLDAIYQKLETIQLRQVAGG
jgi:protein involved in sex pheromone biosynthesis